MSSEEKVHLEPVDSEALKQSLTSVVDSSISFVGTSISALSGEYKHLDELMKLMVMKLKDIHQQVVKEGNEWFDKRSETLDSLSPFLTDIETLHDNSEALLKMMNKIDTYTKSLETKVKVLF